MTARPEIHRGQGLTPGRRARRLQAASRARRGGAGVLERHGVQERRRGQLRRTLQLRRPAARPSAWTRCTATAWVGRAPTWPSSRRRTRSSTASATSTTPTSGSRPATTRPSRPAGSGAGSIATATATNPLQAISIDTALSKSIRTAVNPVCAIPSLPMAGFTMNSSNYGGGGTGDSTSTPTFAACRRSARGRTTPTSPARAPPTASRSRPGSAARTPGRRPAPGIRPRTGRSPIACGQPRTCSPRTSARGSSRSTGAASTRTPASSPARTASSPSSRARSAAFRADLVSAGHRAARGHARLLGVRAPRARESGTGTEAGTDHGAGGLMMAMGSGVRGGFAADWPGCETERADDAAPTPTRATSRSRRTIAPCT